MKVANYPPLLLTLCAGHPTLAHDIDISQHLTKVLPHLRDLTTTLSTMSSSSPPKHDAISSAHEILFNEGLRIRYEVAGKAYVDQSLANGSSAFARPMQELVTEACWGSVWSRPWLERKTRSMLNIAMLCALNRGPELAVHVRGALNNGATEVEIREVLLQVAIYCGMPAGLEGFKIAERVILEVKEKVEA
ncbi:AhpD-like protein [Halenospora varia]|nr:AhpD-like protein [Halenospora varia]